MAKIPLEIDLATRIISESDRLWVLFPGKSHKFYDNFRDGRSVYLDLPGFGVDKPRKAPDAIEMGKRLLVSARVRSWHNQQRPADKRPNRDLRRYRDLPIPKSRAHLAGAAKELYYGIGKGELVIVPGPGYFSDVLIGEIVDEIGAGTSARSDDYPNEEIPARAIRWLNRIPKWSLSEGLIKRLQLRAPLVLLDKTFRDEIYRLSFPNYIYDSCISAQFETTKRDFSSKDDLNFQLVLNHVAAIMAEISIDNDDRSTISLAEAFAIVQVKSDYVPELIIEISSPGTLTAISEKITPLVASAVLALMLSGMANAKPLDVKVINRPAPDDTCVLDVDQHLTQVLAKFAPDEWEHHCIRIHSTKNTTGLKTHSKVREAKASSTPVRN